MSPGPAPESPERVADAAVGVAEARRRHASSGEHHDERGERVVLKLLADGQVDARRDAELAQVRGRADARAQQDRGRVDRARAQQHVAGAQLLPARRRAGSARPPRDVALEEHAVDRARRPGSTGSGARDRLEVRVVRADAHAVAAVDRVRRDAERARRVVIRRPAMTEVERGLAERLVHRAPARERRAVDRDRTRVTVVVRRAVAQVGLEPVEVRQQLGERPALAALRGPAVEVLDHAADGDLSVHRRAAAETAAAPEHARRLHARAPRLQCVPAERAYSGSVMIALGLALRIASGASRAAVVRAGLEQRDAARRGSRSAARPGWRRPTPRRRSGSRGPFVRAR